MTSNPYRSGLSIGSDIALEMPLLIFINRLDAR